MMKMRAVRALFCMAYASELALGQAFVHFSLTCLVFRAHGGILFRMKSKFAD